MTRKRFFALFLLIVGGFLLLEIRLMLLMIDSEYTEISAQQGRYTKEISVNRPDFYDCNGVPLTGSALIDYAVLSPQNAASVNVLKYTDALDRDTFDALMQGNIPFLVPLDEPLPPTEPFQLVSLRTRYSDDTLAKHLIGYLNYERQGVSGLEYTFEEYLDENKTATMMSLDVDALGRTIAGSAINFYESDYNSAGVRLTIDGEIQRMAEQIADDSFQRGAIVVLDLETMEIKAMVSRPDFLQDDLAAAIAFDDGALVNRAVNAYNIGSVYKPLIAAAALEAGIPESFTHTCEGSITVNGFTYACNNSKVHGEMTMQTALEQSCNTYFIALAQQVGSEAVYNMAVSMGLGKPVTLCDGYETARGFMPGIQRLQRDNELCIHAFGQGTLLATPVHVALYTAAIARGGVFAVPSIVQKVGGTTVERTDAPKQVFSAATAEMLQRSLISTVENGSAYMGKPQTTTAAGKTGTAQTGVYKSNGTEKIMGWFTGWFPAESPRYVITVMVEDQGYGFESAAPVFGKLADAIHTGFYEPALLDKQ